MDNDLDVMKNTFEMKAHPRLSILDVVICMTSSGESTLVSIYILVNPRTKRQINRDKTPSTQNNSIPCTVPDSTIIEKSRITNNFLSPTVHTDLDHSNSDKITLRNISDQSFLGSWWTFCSWGDKRHSKRESTDRRYTTCRSRCIKRFEISPKEESRSNI